MFICMYTEREDLVRVLLNHENYHAHLSFPRGDIPQYRSKPSKIAVASLTANE